MTRKSTAGCSEVRESAVRSPETRETAGRYPQAPRSDAAEEFHGVVVADPYRVLEDPLDERTLAWTAAQEALFQRERAGWPHLPAWHAELVRLSRVALTSPPRPRGKRVFFTRRQPGEDQPTLMVSEGGVTRPLVSPAALDPTGRTVLEAWHPSIEGDLVAYQLSTGGTEESLLRVLDVATGEVVDGPVDRVRRAPVAWLPGGRAFYYVRRLPPELNPGEERYHRRVYLHRVGSDPDGDVAVFGDGRDKTSFYTVAVTPDGRWLTVTATVGANPATDVWLADLSACPPERPDLRPVQVGLRARGALRIAPGAGPYDPLWLHTGHEAPRGRVVVTTAADPGPETWRTLIPERPDAVLAEFVPLTGAELPRPLALVRWTRHAVSEITVHDLADGRELGRVPLPGSGDAGPFSVRPEPGHEAWFAYCDHTTPPIVLRYDARTGTLNPDPPGAEPPVNIGFAEAGSAVATSHVTFTSHDGTPVRMFVLAPHGEPDRPRPAILTGYGGFGVSMSPGYMPQALAWVRAGGVFAIACLRGGGEEGEEWHQAGTRVRKQRVFDDFDAAADYLFARGWTGPGLLGIMGESNGGLLTAAALTQHPGKYAAVVCVAPLLDMIAYERLGMGPSWRNEYGSVRDPDEFRALLAYSPYHAVRPGVRYPPVLFAVADGDTRVDPCHSRKMCAMLQHASAGPGPVLYRLERDVGHGARAASRKAALLADVISFLAAHLGLEPPA
ncbi:prolyl endopeptidase [Microbispora rosea subsp. aerata]|nr:prolyl oligopeptidase family serine peptidase [Microbispora rosea]GGO22261.1 prolyl endopeptidase [Microbispora rosea subsp. aerata]GIH57480.1 prolyl endopeptidase [Microbispora rosea subsp. aerata]GLJ86430.1 prolyl endopeptidase [Microbispora rosea subsp. aerata]